MKTPQFALIVAHLSIIHFVTTILFSFILVDNAPTDPDFLDFEDDILSTRTGFNKL